MGLYGVINRLYAKNIKKIFANEIGAFERLYGPISKTL